MQARGRGSFPYRGREGRGQDNILSQHGKKKLIVANIADLSDDLSYQEFFQWKKTQRSNTPKSMEESITSPEISSYANIVATDDDKDPNKGFIKKDKEKVIFLINHTDLKWENTPWKILERYISIQGFLA